MTLVHYNRSGFCHLLAAEYRETLQSECECTRRSRRNRFRTFIALCEPRRCVARLDKDDALLVGTHADGRPRNGQGIVLEHRLRLCNERGDGRHGCGDRTSRATRSARVLCELLCISEPRRLCGNLSAGGHLTAGRHSSGWHERLCNSTCRIPDGRCSVIRIRVCQITVPVGIADNVVLSCRPQRIDVGERTRTGGVHTVSCSEGNKVVPAECPHKFLHIPRY